MFVFRLCRRRILSSVLNQTVSSVKTCPLMYKRHFDEKDASKVTLTDKKLTSISKSELLEEPVQKQLELLDRSGIGSHHAQQYPQLLSVRPDHLVNYTSLLREIELEEDAIVEMLVSSPELVFKCYKTCKGDLRRSHQHRIQFICQELKISQKELCSKLSKYKFVLSLSLKRIKDVLKVLLEHGVTPADILSDFWIIRCKATSVASRLDQVKDIEVDSVRPWMGRCKKVVFDRFMKRASSKQKTLGELSLEEYISQRLDCSVSEIKEIIDREPQLQKTSVLKIKKILDFLFSSGFSPSHILAGLPRVANRRIETIHSRLQEMNQEGLPPTLYVLCKSKREYQYYINKRKKRET